MTFEEILRTHSKKYPKMRPCDAVKLVYQSEFGGGHLIKDSDKSLLRIKEELSSLNMGNSGELYESIGSGLCRVNLSRLSSHGLTSEWLNKVFVTSAREVKGSVDEFEKKLQLLLSLANDGLFEFDAPTLAVYISDYKAAGYPPVSHSDEYRAAYNPAYRVVLEKYVK